MQKITQWSVRAYAEGDRTMSDFAKLPSITIGDRTYDILDILHGEETKVAGDIMVERAKEMNAHLGQDDGQYLLDNQQDIPADTHQLVFVFTDWHRPNEFEGDNAHYIYTIYWNTLSERWWSMWERLDRYWGDHYRLLRRQ